MIRKLTLFTIALTFFTLRSFSVVGPASAQTCVCTYNTVSRTCELRIPTYCNFSDTAQCQLVTSGSFVGCDAPPACICLTPTPLPPGFPSPTPSCGRDGFSCCPNYPRCLGSQLQCIFIAAARPPTSFCMTEAGCDLIPGGCPLGYNRIFCDLDGHPTSYYNPDNPRIYTAIGCISTDAPTAVSQILSLLLKLSGGVALLLVIVAGIQMIFAGGNSKQIQAGKELISAVIAGIILLSLCILILNFAGVNVLGLQNLGFRT
jgi:hypothetical protein